MNKLRKGKVLGIAAACLLVASLAGALVAPAILAQEAPSVSIVPETQEVEAGEAFDIDVWVDANDNNLRGIDVAVEYDADAMTTTGGDVVGHNLLGYIEMPPEVTEAAGVGEVTYVLASVGAVADVDASVMTITFTMDAAAVPGDYALTITKAELADENVLPVVVGINDGTVTVSGPSPEEAPSVSIVPDSLTAEAGGSFSVDVVVDSEALLVKACEVEVTFDTDLTATDAIGLPLLGTPVLAIPASPNVAAGSVIWTVFRIGDNVPAAVEGDFMTIDFAVDAAAEGTYVLAIEATLLDENNAPITILENDGQVTVLAPAEFTLANLVVTPTSGVAPLSITASAEVTNIGGVANNYTAVLKVDDAVVASQEVTVAAGATETATFTYELSAVGIYLVTIDELTAIEVTVLSAEPEVFEQTFTGSLDEGDRDSICTIPAGVTELEIGLTATADLDIELWDGTTCAVGGGDSGDLGEIDSAPGGTYERDEFGYSGWSGGEESISADGPLGRAYDLKVYAYQAGDYTVDVYYEIPAGVDVTPPTVTIDVPAGASVGNAATVTVSAADPSGVAMVMFMVSSPYPEPPEMAASQVAYEDMVQFVMSFSDAASVTFVPGWAGTYTVYAWAMDDENNMTPEGNPVTLTFEIVA